MAKMVMVLIRLGIIADTHIPDRVPRLHPRILPVFQEAGVEAILHAGDVCVPGVLKELEAVAPVQAVRGNRDWISLRQLPKRLILEYGGVTIGLVHGHGDLLHYLIEKPRNLILGLKTERYVNYVLSVFSDVDVIIFGHLHRAVLERVGSRLVFDPGSACCAADKEKGPSVGLLNIQAGGKVEGEIVYLNNPLFYR